MGVGEGQFGAFNGIAQRWGIETPPPQQRAGRAGGGVRDPGPDRGSGAEGDPHWQGGMGRGGRTRLSLKLGRVGFAEGGRDPKAAPAGYYRSTSSRFLVLVLLRPPPPPPKRELSPRRATAAGHVIRANMAAAAGGS